MTTKRAQAICPRQCGESWHGSETQAVSSRSETGSRNSPIGQSFFTASRVPTTMQVSVHCRFTSTCIQKKGHHVQGLHAYMWLRLLCVITGSVSRGRNPLTRTNCLHSQSMHTHCTHQLGQTTKSMCGPQITHIQFSQRRHTSFYTGHGLRCYNVIRKQMVGAGTPQCSKLSSLPTQHIPRTPHKHHRLILTQHLYQGTPRSGLALPSPPPTPFRACLKPHLVL